jgi:hypothetical protein
MKIAVPSLCALLALAGCAGAGAEDAKPAGQLARFDWRDIATDHDRGRLRDWRTAWVEALAKARPRHAAEIAREGVLLDPDAGQLGAPPQPGDYACRVIKVGAKSEGLLDYIAYPAFNCRIGVENGVLSFAKLTGSQRPIGLILPDTERRSIFLGTLQLGDERLALQYGRDQERDMAGVVERIGDGRWRIAFPRPHFESTLDVLELIPRG